jgi:general stress protein YciG
MSSSEMTGGGSVNGGGGALGEAAQAPRKKQRRGFAAMDSAKQKEIASKGGKASHAHGTGHEWNASSAREAGRKGGLASHGGRGKNAVKQ